MDIYFSAVLSAMDILFARLIYSFRLNFSGSWSKNYSFLSLGFAELLTFGNRENTWLECRTSTLIIDRTLWKSLSEHSWLWGKLPVSRMRRVVRIMAIRKAIRPKRLTMARYSIPCSVMYFSESLSKKALNRSCCSGVNENSMAESSSARSARLVFYPISVSFHSNKDD